MTDQPEPSPANRSANEARGDTEAARDPDSLSYDDFLVEVNRMAATREAASRRERDARTLSLATLGVALAALGVALVALAVAILKA